MSTTVFTRDDIDISTRAADQFTRLYYSTYDSPARAEDLPKFYRPTSTLTWNGNPCQGVDGVKKLIQNMPSTKHEVQSYDCHPIPGYSEHPVNTPSRSVDGQPRVFFQTFMLVPDPAAPIAGVGEVAKYYVDADSMRFVG
ncbi:hypothetical protein L210DRAFT_3619538 [Boletus edulis BED1]|uniref:NTF2-related export protein n=1 Tax=Boletus edulis BED1 TaxID=1328754 RepID=A0AAD4C1C8_BOLED|nr:hypothetical protein L210DRAFT_3619538 [Boletus edulis BED1]